MNILKNLEAVVIGAVALTFVTAMATAATTPAPAPADKPAPVAVAAGDDVNMVTIVDTGTRLTLAQKKAGV